MLINIDEYSNNIDEVEELLSSIAKVIKDNKDLFQWWEQKASKTKQFLKRIPDAIIAQPGIFGFSFDLKKFFQIEKLFNK